MPAYVRVDGLPANETLTHFILKWAAHRVLTRELGCPYALVEGGARPSASGRSRWPRHDALGVRFRAGRALLPWREVPAEQVRVQTLEASTGRWRTIPPDAVAAVQGDPTLRAFERGPDARQIPLRAVAPGRAPGSLRVRPSGRRRRELAQLCGADAKQSRADLQAWLRDAPRRTRGVQLFLLVTPAGLTRPDELPPRIGLAEVDTDRLGGSEGGPPVRLARVPEPLRSAVAWPPERTLEFARRAYFALNGLFDRQLFWFLAQEAMERRRRWQGPAAAAAPVRGAAAIRVYQPSDREAVVVLWRRAGIALPEYDLGAEIDLHQRHAPQLMLVAEAGDGRVVAAVMGGWDGRRGWVHHLAVDPDRRRRGLGTALLAEVEARLASLGCRKVRVLVRGEHRDVLGFYRGLGFVEEGVSCLSHPLVGP